MGFRGAIGVGPKIDVIIFLGVGDGGVPEIMDPLVGVPVIRIFVFAGVCWVPYSLKLPDLD